MGAIKSRRKNKISVRYNTQKVGAFRKNIIVYSNASNPVINLQIKGVVFTP